MASENPCFYRGSIVASRGVLNDRFGFRLIPELGSNLPSLTSDLGLTFRLESAEVGRCELGDVAQNDESGWNLSEWCRCHKQCGIHHEDDYKERDSCRNSTSDIAAN